jgi:ABC-type transport system involved in multi-copper enzyme maturation permease subunit
MWKPVFTFELRYWFRGFMLWIFLAVLSLLIFFTVSTDHVHVGGVGENTLKNAPYVIGNFYAVVSLLALLMTTAFVNSAAARDFASRTDQILFSTPIRKSDFLLGRFLGAAVVSTIPLLGVSVGVLAGKFMPWVDGDRWGPVNWNAHLWGILAFAIPNTLIVASVLFAVAAWRRSTIFSFLGALLLLTGYGVAGAYMSDMKNETLGALLDPFGIEPFALMTKYWTVAERNTQTLTLSGILLWNRLLWLTVAGGVFASSFALFSFTARAGRRRTRAPQEEEAPATARPLPATAPAAGSAAWAKLRFSLRSEFRALVKSTVFLVVLAAALLNTLPSLVISANEGFGDHSFPVTYLVIEQIAGALYLFVIALITFFAGMLVWRDQDARMDEIEHCLPVPDWVPYVAKLLALMLSLALIQLLMIATGVLVQAFSGYTRFQPGLYFTELLGMHYSWFFFLAVAAFLFHVVSPNKFVGYAGYIIFMIANAFVWKPLRMATYLVRYGSRPDTNYSDFFGHAPYLAAWSWFTAYWMAFAALLAVVSILLWRRGRESSWRHRLRMAAQRFRGPLRPFAAVAGALFLVTGAWAFYNTKVLNTLRSEHDSQKLQADYEKSYKKYEGLPQPRVTDVRFGIELYPETRNATVHLDQELRNKTGAPIDRLHISLPRRIDYDIRIPGATIALNDARLGYRVYQLSPALAPGAALRMTADIRTRTRGFENELTTPQLVDNGTFFNNADIVPQIGYQPGQELEEKNDRKEFGLKERARMPELERNCTVHCANTYLSNHADWVTVESVVGTSGDQTAIAPGSLLNEWRRGNRRYFHYRLDHPEVNFYSFLSARYEVLRASHEGRNVEIYYLKEHPWNVPRMRQAVERSLAYYSANFSPYRHRQARIIEFPRVASFAQAFPGTMPYSESIGFIADLRDAEDVDKVFWVVSHEMAHQWWAYQLIGANMQGATLLSETLAQYSSLMVLEKEYGRDMMRKFLKYSMDRYLRARGRESLKERPLVRVEASQGYIHYDKGAVALYQLKEMIGEEAVNRALRSLLARYAYAEPPYPTAWALVDALRAETPPALQYLVTDLIEDITLFSNRTLEATATRLADGRYDVTIQVETRKFKADEKGNEREVAPNDWIEIGAFAAPAKGRKFGDSLYRQRVHVTANRGTYHFTVARAPAEAGIDPFQLLVDRVPDDNTKTVAVAR